MSSKDAFKGIAGAVILVAVLGIAAIALAGVVFYAAWLLGLG